MASSLLDLDPTGTLSAVGAGVSLVGAALRLGTAAKKLNDSRNPGGGGGATGAGAPPDLHRSQTNPTEVPVLPKDPERERRAYETVNFVLRELGSRICAAGMVDEHALTKALNSATQHIDINLFSGEANRLFESLAPKLDDPILVNSVFTSIYFIGALSAELATSLPNYKDTYTPVGPRLVQQLFRAAIGEDAFRDNLSANLDAYKTLTTTAGLLRPTDIGYATFPRFPSFSPCKYSGRGFSDTRTNKTTYEKLIKHFERAGFPQPTPTRQVEVGLIRDWKFLWGDSNSRAFDVDKADKNIGENFGRVLHWLICNADRLPPGNAVIAYYDQHIELIKWIQHRMGYAVLYPATDLDFGGPHMQLERRLRVTIDSWVILMPSEAAQAAKRANSEHWMSTHIRTAARAPPFIASKAAVPRPTSMAIPQSTQVPFHPAQSPPPAAAAPFFIVNAAQPDVSTSRGFSPPPPDQGFSVQVPQDSHASFSSGSHPVPQMAPSIAPAVYQIPPMGQSIPPAYQGAPPMRQPSQNSTHSASGGSITHVTNRVMTTIPTSPPMSSASSPPRSPAAVEMPTQSQFHFIPKTAEQQVEEIDQQFQSGLVPQFYRLWYSPSADPGIRDSQCKVLDHNLERETIERLDRIEVPEYSTARLQRKGLIDRAQELMDFLPIYKELGPSATEGRPLPSALQVFAQRMGPSSIVSSSAPPESQIIGPPPEPQNVGPIPSTHSPESSRPAESQTSLSTIAVPDKPKSTTGRRKAPPPPKKFISAKALYDFEPDPENEEEVGFNEDDEIEIIEKTAAMDEDGWCRARVKGSRRIGLMPLEYLEIEEKKVIPPAAKPKTPVASPTDATDPAQNLSRGMSTTSNPPAPSQSSAHQPPGVLMHPPPAHSQHAIPTHPPSAHPPPAHSPLAHPPPAHSPSAHPLPAHSPPAHPPPAHSPPAHQPSPGIPEPVTLVHHRPPGMAPPPSFTQQIPGGQSHPSSANHYAMGPTHPSSASPLTTSTSSISAPHARPTHPQTPHPPATVHSPPPGLHGATPRPPLSSSISAPVKNTKISGTDAAGLATAAIGAVAGVGALLKGVGKLEGQRNHSHGAGLSGRPSHQPQQGGNFIAGGQSAGVGSNGGTFTTSTPPPIVDLSAFGEAPFDPRNATLVQQQYYVPQQTFPQQTAQTDYVANSTTVYNGGFSSTDVVQDTTTATFYDTQETASTPFASTAVASTTDTTTVTDTTVTSGDGVTSTYETYSDDQTYSADDTVDDVDCSDLI